MSKDSILIPGIKFYNQDVVDLYNKTWTWIDENWIVNQKNKKIPHEFLTNPNQISFNYFYSLLPSFFLVYNSQKYSPISVLDYFYSKQEENGAIYSDYDKDTGERLLLNKNDKVGVCIPIFPWVEHNYYIKSADKKRLKEVVGKLDKFYKWLKSEFMDDTGLFRVEEMNYVTGNIDRSATAYPVEFNAAMAFYCLKMVSIGEILKDKDLKLYYKKQNVSLKNRMNRMMWHNDFYLDLDKDANVITGSENIGAYFALLGNICDFERAEIMIAALSDKKMFATENPFPTIPVKNKRFNKDGNGFYGGVSSVLTFIVIKALASYKEDALAKEFALKHIFCIIDSDMLDDKKIPPDVWEVYKPNDEGPSLIFNNAKHSSYELPRRHFLPALGIMTITLLVENIVGFEVMMPLKSVKWTLVDYDHVGISNYYMKKNYISLECVRTDSRWEIHLDSEKLYYLTIEILGKDKKKNLSIPAGKCSILPDKF